jgi:hypothetical protein
VIDTHSCVVFPECYSNCFNHDNCGSSYIERNISCRPRHICRTIIDNAQWQVATWCAVPVIITFLFDIYDVAT